MSEYGQYNENSIWSPERLEYVRMRPTALLPSTGIEGLVHQAIEIITNGIDEIALMAEMVGKLLVMLCFDAEKNTYQVVVTDNGRGLPIGKLLDSYTKMHTSGKFNTNAYEHSGGLFGQGGKATAGTSRHFKAITHCAEASAAIYVNEGKTDEVVELINTPPVQTGVTVIFEPDPIIMTSGIDTFYEVGRDQLLILIQKYCFFRKMNIELRIHSLGLPEKIWLSNIPEAEAIVAKYVEEATVVFNEATFDRNAWIRSYLGITRPFMLQNTIHDSFLTTITKPEVREVMVRYEVRFYYVKFSELGGRFGMVNNVAIDDLKSTHFLTVMDALKQAISVYIKEAPLRKFFLDQYRVPIYLAVDVKYPGAEFASTTKSAFLSREFRNVYEPSIKKQLAMPESVAFIAALYQQLAADIEDKYTNEVLGVVKVKNFNRLFEEVKGLSELFKDCWTTNRSTAELFLVEGDSAGSSVIEGRNSEFQALYKLRGKPFNGITTIDNIRQTAVDIRDNDIYQNIITITGINPNKFNPNTLNFRSLNVLTDADSHGQHITAILVGNFYALCPEIITSGMLNIITPPLYSLAYTAKKMNLPNIYFRDELALRDWLIENVYMKTFTFGERVKHSKDKTRLLEHDECIRTLRNVLEIGEAIDNLSRELLVDPPVVERLTYITAALDPSLEKIDVARIKQLVPDVDRVTYEQNGNILILTIGSEDHIIPLKNVWKRLIDTVLPLMNRIQWRKKQIYITTKNSSEFRDREVSIMKLNDMLTTLDKQFSIERYKGLGSMKPADMGRVCMDPQYRNMYKITEVGDVQRIFALLGKNTAARKQLLSRT